MFADFLSIFGRLSIYGSYRQKEFNIVICLQNDYIESKMTILNCVYSGFPFILCLPPAPLPTGILHRTPKYITY